MTSAIYQNGDYLAKHPTWHTEDAPWKAAQVRRLLTRNGVRPRTICEVGCGAGAILAELQRNYQEARLWGYEVSPQAFDLCRPLANDRLRFVLGDILEQPPARFFDLVLVMDVVEHVEDHLRFLRGTRPLGQYKLFHFPLDLSLQGLIRDIPCKVRSSAGHLHYFTKSLVLRTLEEAGYRVIDCCYTPAAEAVQSPALGTRLMRLPRKAFFALQADLAALSLGGFSLLVLTI